MHWTAEFRLGYMPEVTGPPPVMSVVSRHRTRMARIALLISLAALLGCSAHKWSVCHYSREIFLASQQQTILGTEGVRLHSIAPDGTATIELLSSGEKLAAKPGEFFVCRAFGTQGLELVSASPEKGEVVLRQRWAESK